VGRDHRIVLEFPAWLIGDTVEAAYKQIYYYTRRGETPRHGWRLWMQHEATLTTQLAGTLAGFPADWLGEAFHILLRFPAKPDRYEVVKYDIRPNFLEPDILLRSTDHLLMIEAKTLTRGPKSHKFPPTQVLHYALLPVLRQKVEDPGLPTKFTLLILVPGDWRDSLQDYPKWVRNVDEMNGGRVYLQTDGLIEMGMRQRLVRAYQQELRNVLDSMPVFCRTWGELSKSFAQVYRTRTHDPYRAHWSRMVGEIETLKLRALGPRGSGQ